ncbi:unnamed protein product [Phytomonas sp. EM1]|nr:unnamed protein product [Phytomonas sp. EM1]|eukprot:CCW62737.1 unnamed protein product [Phytomonas sp. isolate EM1]
MGNCYSVKLNTTKLRADREALINQSDATTSQHIKHAKDDAYLSYAKISVYVNRKDAPLPSFVRQETNTHRNRSPASLDRIGAVHRVGAELPPPREAEGSNRTHRNVVQRKSTGVGRRAIKIRDASVKAKTNTAGSSDKACAMKPHIPSTPTQRPRETLASQDPLSPGFLSSHASDNDLVLICLDCGMTIDEESVGIICPLTAKLHA